MGASLLVLAAVCWGFGFYAQRVSISELSPLWATAARFVLALPVVLGALWWRRRRGVALPWVAGSTLAAPIQSASCHASSESVPAPGTKTALVAI